MPNINKRVFYHFKISYNLIKLGQGELRSGRDYELEIGECEKITINHRSLDFVQVQLDGICD